MTISYVEPVKTYVSSGNGAYPFTFKVLAESDIEVWYTSALTGARVQLVRGSDFSVTISDPGGTVTILGNAPAGGQILIQRRVPIDQPTNWVNNGPFDMDLLEADLDRIIMIVQQLGWDVSSGQAAINYRGPWATSTAYTIRDIVRTANGNYYFCVVSHTSGTFATDLAAGNWVLLIDFEAIETHATNAAASAANALASRNTAIARSAAAELSEIAAAASAAAAAADADEIRDWPVSTGLATDVAEHLAFSRKNLLINGGFDVWQDGTAFAGGGGDKYTADQWFLKHLVFTGSAVYRDIVDPLLLDDARELKYALRFVVGAMDGAALIQKIEYLPRFSGKTLTCSFWAMNLVGNVELDVQLNANYGTGGAPSTPTSPIASGTGMGPLSSDTFTRQVVTFVVPDMSNAPFVFGTDYGTSYLELEFSAGNLTASDVSCIIMDVQLEFGDTATDFEYRHPAEELALCQRYYEKGTLRGPFAQYTAAYAAGPYCQYLVAKRTDTPSVTVGTLEAIGHDGTPGSYSLINSDSRGFGVVYSWTGGTVGRSFVGRFSWTVDARL